MGSNVEMAKTEEEASLDHLPSAIVGTIMTKLDIPSICSLASTSSAFRSSARNMLSFRPNFHLLDIAPSEDLLRPLLPPNPHLTSLKVDCGRLDDNAIPFLLKPSLNDLSLHNCSDFSGRLLSEIGTRCRDLRSLYLGSVAENRGRPIRSSDLGELLSGCSRLEALILMFDVSVLLHYNSAQVWASASEKLTSLEIGQISSVTVTELLSHNLGSHLPSNPVQPSILPGIQKLCLNVDYITDAMVGTISKGLTFLTHLDLQDAPQTEPRITFDLTNAGLQQINQLGRLKHLSLVRSQEYLITACFRRVNDLGLLLMADKCANLESICLGGFCRATDTGFKTILHACTRLYKLKVTHGTHLTDLVFHDISATSLALTHVSLRRCNLLTNHAVLSLASNKELKVLDLRDCRNFGDEALQAIGTLPRLKVLLLDGSDITDAGLLYLRSSVISSLYALSLRGCKRLTDKCITALFNGCCVMELRELDLSNLPNLSDNGVLMLAKSRIPFFELRMRQCPLIGDTSVMALASMLVDEARHGSSLRLLDLYHCGGITPLAFRWLKRPYFPRLKWLGVTGSVNRDIVDALARSRPFLHVTCNGDELGADPDDTSDGLYTHDYDDVDEFEQWLLEADIDSDYEEMGEAENNDEIAV